MAEATKPARLVLPMVVGSEKPKILYEAGILRLLCHGTRNGGAGEFKKKHEN